MNRPITDKDLYLDTKHIAVGDRFSRLVFNDAGERVPDGVYTCICAGDAKKCQRYVFELTDCKDPETIHVPIPMLKATLFNKCPGVIKLTEEV